MHGPLVRERETCTPLVSKFLAANPDPARKETARSLLAAMERADEPPQPVLTEREREVLERLETQGDKQIAAALGISTHGVRYHLRNLFTKLGARNRAEAARHAREMGLIPETAEKPPLARALDGPESDSPCFGARTGSANRHRQTGAGNRSCSPDP